MARKTSVAAAAIARPAVLPGQELPHLMPCVKPAMPATDYFIEEDGLTFAGKHVLLDFWGCENLDQLDVIERAFRQGALAAGATLLDVRLHCFESSGGISGVAILAESHISIHTWPERGYAALDIFMCGKCDPYKAVAVLREALSPETIGLHEQRRGLTT